MTDKNNSIDPNEDYEELQAYGEFFSFDTPGKTLKGVFKGTEEIEGQFGIQTYWRILDSDEVLYLVAENTKMERYRTILKEGDNVVIEFTEWLKSKKGNEFKDFKVLRKKKAPF